MAEFLGGPIGQMAKAMPKYGEVFTGASSARSVANRRLCDRPSRIRRFDPNAPRDRRRGSLDPTPP